MGTLSAGDPSSTATARGVVAGDLARCGPNSTWCSARGPALRRDQPARNGFGEHGLARAANIPVVVVGDIDRGGVLAHLFGGGRAGAGGPGADRRFHHQQVPGDPALLAPGSDQLAALTGGPTYGWFPTATSCGSDAEDSVSVSAREVVGVPALPRDGSGCASARSGCPSPTPPISRALACEPGVLLARWVTDQADIADVDVVVIRHQATVADLARLREGLADAIAAHAGSGRVVLGIVAASRCCVDASTTPSSPAPARSPAWGCSTPTSSFAPTRSCAAGRLR